MQHTDFIVIGSGIAGIRAAIELASHGETIVLTKSKADESNTEYAQGGIAVAMSDEDEIGLHYQDTMRAGDGLCNQTAVQVLAEEGPARIQELIDWGMDFDREGMKLSFTHEAAHSRRRILHAGGDSTGREINRTLVRKAQSLKNVHLLPYSFVISLLVDNSGCQGVCYLDEKTGQNRKLLARTVLLASGGLGRIYRETTNPDITTGDGYALALEAGAALTDMEFVQFHPTALKLKGAPHFLLSEALRGEGGCLRNAEGNTFMERYHELGDLASRDIVCRSIFREIKESGGKFIFLDLTHLDAKFIRQRFPHIYTTCLKFGLDITQQWIPVFPATHYMMGGVYTDLCGRTTLARLFAAGEVACSGVHGANRLASNSLLEGLVYGTRAGQAMADEKISMSPVDFGQVLQTHPWKDETNRTEGRLERKTLRALMSRQVGIDRSEQGLRATLKQLQTTPFLPDSKRKNQELHNMIMTARLIATMALLRQESRGAHHRIDFPERDDRNWKQRIVARYYRATEEVIYTVNSGTDFRLCPSSSKAICTIL